MKKYCYPYGIPRLCGQAADYDLSLMTKKHLHKRSQSLGNLTGLSKQANGLLLTTDNGVVQLTVYSPSVIRVRINREQTGADFSYAVTAVPEATATEVEESETQISLSTSLLRVVIAKNPVRLSFYTEAGQLLNEEETFGTAWIGEQCTAYKKLQPGEKFIGLGEKSGNLNRRGEGYTNWNTDAFAYSSGTDPLYCTLPFYMGIHSGTAYGIFLDNTYKTHFNFGAANNRFSSFTTEDGEMNYYFIYQPTVAGIIESYTALTGRTELPPLWGLGYQQCRYSYYPDKEVLNLARTFREKSIPADVIYLDIHYMDAYKVFTWHPERFPHPKQMLDELKNMGFHVVVIADPGIKEEPGYAAYDEGMQKDVFVKYPDNTPYSGEVWPGWCHFPDFTNPAGRQWWGESFRGYVNDGITGFWNDMNEPSTWGQRLPDLVEFDFDGQKATHRAARNVYGLLMARSTFEGTKKLMEGKRPLVLTRAAYAGIQRYSAIWTGDNIASDEHMLLGVRLVTSMGLTGVPFTGFDVGGFINDASKELFARWIAIGAFTPFFRGHTMINSTDHEPWSFGEQVEDISRNYIQLRYKLLPYLYSCFYESSRTGMPVARSLAIDYTHDPVIYEHRYQNQYLFGPSLMVIPVASNRDLVKAYLPEGGWYDLYNEQYYEGGEIIAECPVDRLPVYVKAGAILPMQSVVQHAGEMPETTLRIHVYHSRETSSFVYYEDDGDSYAYQTGVFYERSIQYDPAARQIVFSPAKGQHTPRFEYLKVIFHHFEPFNEIAVNGTTGKPEDETVVMLRAVSDFDPLGAKHTLQRQKDKSLTFKNTAEKIVLQW